MLVTHAPLCRVATPRSALLLAGRRRGMVTPGAFRLIKVLAEWYVAGRRAGDGRTGPVAAGGARR